MNKNFLNSLPAEDQPAASKLSSLVKDLQLSPSFQEELQMKLMDTARKKPQSLQSWRARILPALAWAVVAIGAVLILNWATRSLAYPAPAAIVTPPPVPAFEDRVRHGTICAGPLAVSHGFAVSLTNDDKTAWIPLDEKRTIPEMRSFVWSPDGSRLAIIANVQGQGNVFLADTSHSLQPVLSNSELGYLMDGAWSRDGKQIVLWSLQNNKVIHVLSVDGSTLIEKQLDTQILGTPQFAPDGKSVIFYGADTNTAGLFELKLDSAQVVLVNRSVKDPGGYAFSPDGSYLASMEYDRGIGEARLVAEKLATGEKTTLGSIAIPGNSGAALPDSANLSWSSDGKFLVFDFGQYASSRLIYLAPTDGTGLIKIADPGYAPSISADGKCLAYLNDNKVMLMDVNNISSTTKTAPLFIGDLPDGRGNPNFKQDKLQWRP